MIRFAAIFCLPAALFAQSPMDYEATPSLGSVYTPAGGQMNTPPKAAPQKQTTRIGDDRVTGDDLKKDGGALNDWWNATTLKALGAAGESDKALEASLAVPGGHGFDAWLEYVKRYAKSKPKQVGERLLNAPLPPPGRFSLQMTFVRYMRASDPRLAVAYLNTMLGAANETQKPVVLLARGQLLKQAGAYGNAIADLKQVAGSKGSLAADQVALARYLLGELYMRPGSEQNFRFAYNELNAVTIDPNVSQSLRELARERRDQVASLLLNTD